MGAKSDVCPQTKISMGATAPTAPMESAPLAIAIDIVNEIAIVALLFYCYRMLSSLHPYIISSFIQINLLVLLYNPWK